MQDPGKVDASHTEAVAAAKANAFYLSPEIAIGQFLPVLQVRGDEKQNMRNTVFFCWFGVHLQCNPTHPLFMCFFIFVFFSSTRQDMCNLMRRIGRLAVNMVHQMACLYHERQKLYLTTFKTVRMKSVFER